MIENAPLRRIAAACLCLFLAAVPVALAETTPDEAQGAAAPDAAAATVQMTLEELSDLEHLLDAYARNPSTPIDAGTRRWIERRLDRLHSQATAGSGDLLKRVESLRSRARRGPKVARGGGAGGLRALGPTPAAPPANDLCASATAIGHGTFVGETFEAGEDGSATCDGGSSPDVWYEYTAPATGTVFFNTFGSTYDTVLSVHDACPGTTTNQIDCNDDTVSRHSEIVMDVTASDTLYLRVAGWDDAGPYVLNTGLTGSISGTVTETGSGDPISIPTVSVYRVVGGGHEFVDSESTDGSGDYSHAGLAPGTYRVIARTVTLNYVDELYDDIPCPGGTSTCHPLVGTEIMVTAGADTSGIDFVLDPGGSISGTVTKESDGTPVVPLNVEIFDESGNFIKNTLGTGGSYSAIGLPTGEYFVATDLSHPLAEMLYDGTPCQGGGDSGACDPRVGTPVPVTAGLDTSGIDLVLPDGGSITGTVTEEGSGDPLEGITIRVESAEGAFLFNKPTESDGTYDFSGFHSGSFRVIAYLADDYLDEIYDDILCHNGPFEGCPAPGGVPVVVTMPAETSGIDFALAPGGTLSGSVTEDPSTIPLSGVGIEAYNATIDQTAGFGFTSGSGSWSIDGLPSGSYRIQTFSAAPHADELYDDMVCVNGWCDITAGDPVAMTAPAETSGIDFALAAGGAISGTVTEDGSGTPLRGIEVEVFDAAGEFAGWDTTASDGTYTLDGLTTGTYYVGTNDAPVYIDELYDGIVCPGGGCDQTTGTAISVTAPSTTSGIDLALVTGGAIEGTVIDAVTGLPIDDTEVVLFDASGTVVDSVSANGAGHFLTNGLPTGTYYMRTDNFADFLDHRWGSLSCVGSCDADLGSPIVVTSPSTTMGVDFAIYKPGADDALVLSKEDLEGDASFCSEGTITLGPDFGLVGSADLSILAAGSVIFPSGFSAASGTTLEVGVDPAVTCP